MRRTLTLMLALALLLAFSAPALADTTQQGKVLDLHIKIPTATTASDIGNPNVWPTLYAVFPNVVFDLNDKVVADTLSGSRTSFLWQRNDPDMVLIFDEGYYLMPYQLESYERELTKLGIYYPLRKDLVDLQATKPSSAGDVLLRALGPVYLP